MKEKDSPYYFKESLNPNTPHFGFNEPEPELEFLVIHVCMETHTDCGSAASKIEVYLNGGWQIDEKIICPPFVIITFSREKEIATHAQ